MNQEKEGLQQVGQSAEGVMKKVGEVVATARFHKEMEWIVATHESMARMIGDQDLKEGMKLMRHDELAMIVYYGMNVIGRIARIREAARQEACQRNASETKQMSLTNPIDTATLTHSTRT